jgi:hypothetical protein
VLERLRNTSPQLLLILILLGAGVLFSLYKAISSFSAQQESPAYQRTPSSKISPPAPDTLFSVSNDADLLNFDQEGFRMPDQALITVGDGTQEIIDRLKEGTLRGQTLRSLGYRQADADQLAAEMQSDYRQVSEVQKESDDPEVEIDTADATSSNLFVNSTARFFYYTTESEAAAEREVVLSWEPSGQKWRLVQIGNGLG